MQISSKYLKGLCIVKWKYLRHDVLRSLTYLAYKSLRIAEPKGKIKKRKEKKYYYMGYSNLVTHPCTNPEEQGLTFFSRAVLVVW